jgi:N-acylneuraminate cytidylyltransferase
MRPAALALDDTPSLPVIQHAIRFLKDAGESYDALCLLQPTTPLRTSDDIERAAKIFADTGADSVISLVHVGDKHPARMRLIDDEGRVSDLPFVETVEGQRRQTLPPLYLLAGSIYLTRMSVVMEQGTLRGKDSRALIIPEERAINVDTMMDLFLAEHLITLERERSASRKPEAQRAFNSPSRSSTTIQ